MIEHGREHENICAVNQFVSLSSIVKTTRDMLWETQPDNKLQHKSHNENPSPFTFSFDHINMTLPLHC